MYVSDRGDLGLAKREPRLERSWWTESFDSWEDRQGQNRRPRLWWLYKHTSRSDPCAARHRHTDTHSHTGTDGWLTQTQKET